MTVCMGVSRKPLLKCQTANISSSLQLIPKYRQYHRPIVSDFTLWCNRFMWEDSEFLRVREKVDLNTTSHDLTRQRVPTQEGELE